MLTQRRPLYPGMWAAPHSRGAGAARLP